MKITMMKGAIKLYKRREKIMELGAFIFQNQKEIDDYIRMVSPNCDLDNEERENWIMNDESLYNWALNEGVVDI